MSDNIRVNVSKMFSEIEPRYVYGSQAELGPAAGAITWRNAQAIGQEGDSGRESAPGWLLSDLGEAVEAMRGWASETGAWEPEEIQRWHATECLALLAQNIASELRLLGSHEHDLEDLAEIYESTDWDHESEYPVGSYSLVDGELMCDWYAGI